MVLRCTFCNTPDCRRPEIDEPYLGSPKRPSGREVKMLHVNCKGTPYEVWSVLTIGTKCTLRGSIDRVYTRP